jgi:hypothetical protein
MFLQIKLSIKRKETIMSENEPVKQVIFTSKGGRIEREFSIAELIKIEELRKELIPNSALDSAFENNSFTFMPSYKGEPYYKITQIDNLPGENFREHPKNHKIKVSDYGRIKYNDETIKKQNIKKSDYTLSVSEGPVHRLVAETWQECPFKDSTGWVVHHLTNNGLDNRPSNLVWVKEDVHCEIHPELRNFKKKKSSKKINEI